MSIRIETLEKLSRTGRRIYRVKRRAAGMAEDGTWDVDDDGEEGRPESWARCEVEYYSQAAIAVHGARHDKLGRRGFMDLVYAWEVWRELGNMGHDLEKYDQGRLAVLRSMTVDGAGGERVYAAQDG